MTINGLISFISSKNLRTDKDDTILAGINWVKNDLCTSKVPYLWKETEATLTSGQIQQDVLPSDFHQPDKFIIVIGPNWKYALEPMSYQLIDEYQFSGYPEGYCVKDSNTLYVGYSTPGQNFTLEIQYYHKPDDYTVVDDGTSTPVFADLYGDNVYVFGAEWYLWDNLEQYDKAMIALQNYRNERNKIMQVEADKLGPLVLPNSLF